MAYDSTEQEQVDALKRFWDENGKQLFVGIALGLSAFIGYQIWDDNRVATAEAASMEYTQLLDKLMNNQPQVAAEHGSQIIGGFSDTAYAPLAALTMARIKLEEGDAVTARAHLNWAIEHSDSAEIKSVAQIRLASVLLSEGLQDQALTALQKVKDEQFASLRDEVLGDVYVAQQQLDKAQQAYRDALASADQESGQRNALLQMKLDDIAGL